MMKIKKEYLFIALAIISLVSYLSVRKTDRTEYTLPKISKLSSGDITRMEVARFEEIIVLEKKDGSWRIMPSGFVADSAKVNTMLESMENLKLTVLASESKSYFRYDLEPGKVIRIKAWAGDVLKRDIQIGKPAPTFQHTFVRIGDAPQVYHAQQNIRNPFDQTTGKLRDKTVLSFDVTEAKEIVLSKNGEQLAIRKAELPAKEGENPASVARKQAQVMWVTDHGKEADIAKINTLISTLSKLSCETFLEGKIKSDFFDPIFMIIIKGKKEYSLSVYSKIDKDYPGHPAISSESDYVFILSDHDVEKIKGLT